MKSLSDFLQKFKAIRDPSLDKQILSSLIKKHTGIQIDPQSLKIRGTHLIINVHPAVKTALYMKKAPLLEALSSEFPEQKFTDIL